MKLTKRTYTHHYKLSIDIPKTYFWLLVAILSLGLTALLGLAVYRWATSSKTYYINPASEEEPTTMRRLDPSEYSEETKRRMAIVDTNGASPELIHYIEKYAKEYGVSARYLVCLAREESRFNPNATGDGGRAHGVAQWHLGSWQFMREKMGLSTEDLRLCPEESIRTMAFAVANGYSHWWSVANKCAEEKI